MNKELSRFAVTNTGKPVPLSHLKALDEAEFRKGIVSGVSQGWRVSALFAAQTEQADKTDLYVVLSEDEQNRVHVGKTQVIGDRFQSSTQDCPQIHLFEREIAEQFGLIPMDHPWLKPVRYHHSWTLRDAWNRPKDGTILPAVGDFFRVEGEQIHEVSVGPVHAGVIEPGHFRFQCHGEQVFHLEIALGFQHRGIEQALIGGPHKLSLHHAETSAGDTTIAHTTAYCQVLESLCGGQVSARAHVLRGIAFELERLANHVGDLGALSGDVGFLPTASFCGRIRGDFLNMTALLCGNRFGRAMVQPGGVGFDLDDERRDELIKRLTTAEAEATAAINLLWENQSVMARFEDTGILTRETAVELGIVGPPARATGLPRDVRSNQPSGIYRLAQIPMATFDSGDVFARAYIRWLEIQYSIMFIKDQVATIPSGVLVSPLGPMQPESLVVTLNEGWRGEICHVAITGETGRFSRYKIVDPSFHNWIGLAMAMRNQEISDFPLCNKSFNLSYCGHDL